MRVRKIAPANVSRVMVKSRKLRRRFPRTHAWDIATVFLQIIRDLRWLELRRDPEITEEENHRRRERHNAASHARARPRSRAQCGCSGTPFRRSSSGKEASAHAKMIGMTPA